MEPVTVTGDNVKANSSSLLTYDPRSKTMYQAGNIQGRNAFMNFLETARLAGNGTGVSGLCLQMSLVKFEDLDLRGNRFTKLFTSSML